MKKACFSSLDTTQKICFCMFRESLPRCFRLMEDRFAQKGQNLFKVGFGIGPFDLGLLQ